MDCAWVYMYGGYYYVAGAIKTWLTFCEDFGWFSNINSQFVIDTI